MAATEPIWASTAARTPFPRLNHDLEVDVAIVGAGITGVLAALLLAEAGQRVALLEARRVGSGVTGGTTAHLTQVLDTRFHEIERKFGIEKARRIFDSGGAAIHLVEALVRRYSIDCGFERVPGYLFAATHAQTRDIERELEACGRAGIPGVQDWPPLPIPSFGGIRFDDQASFRVLDFVLPLARAVAERGGHVFEDTRAVRIEDGRPCSVHTDDGVSVKATRVVMATHAPLNRFFLQTRLARYRSYVVSGPVEQAPHGLFWDCGEPYHYVRAVRLADEHHLLVGGEDHKTGQERDTLQPFARLESYAATLGLRHVTRRWSAQVIEPVDGLPFIGRNMASRVYVATGFSGNGMTFGALAAKILSDECLGLRNQYADLFEPMRVSAMKSLRTYVSENVDFPAHLVTAAVRPPEVKSVREILPGKGAVARVRGRKLGVYRDEAGQLLAVSPVCTHLGCHVSFNDAEKTWDCPCHGSRFRPDGSIVEGPAVKPLKCWKLEEPESVWPRPARLRKVWAP